MAYGKTTQFYGIPYPVQGDLIEETEEQKRAAIIDNQLHAALCITGAGVSREGEYVQFDSGTGTYGVVLRAAGGPAILGIVNYGLVYTNSTITWSGLVTGSKYYL